MTYYEILEISESASEEVIRTAYKTLAKKYHPDVFQGNPQEAEEKMKQINLAYSILSDNAKRAQYDAKIRSKKSANESESQHTTSSNSTKKPPHRNAHNKKSGFQHYTKTRAHNNKIYTKRHRLVIAVIVLLLVGVASSYNLFIPAPDIEQIKDSVVMVKTYNDNGDALAIGSGFCAYKSYWIVTNFHVIEGAKSISITTDGHNEISVENIVVFNQEEDLAILQIDSKLTPLSIGDGEKIKTKDHITTIGSPKGELNTVSEGIVSNVDDKKQIRISAPISHGSSGGVLLNDKNEVIGITSAGYDDAQNLNFAINVSILEDIYDDYKNNETITITDQNLSKYTGSLNDFEKYLSNGSNSYNISSLNTFFKLTDNYTRFGYLLEEKDPAWFSIFNTLSSNEKKQVVDLFLELNTYSFNDDYVYEDIENWDITDFFISLNILNKYEYAITCIDTSVYKDKELMFNYVNNNYPLGAAEKTLILYLIGNYEWSEISTDNKEDIFDYFDTKYGARDLGAILEVLGYEIVYSSDGTLTAYW